DRHHDYDGADHREPDRDSTAARDDQPPRSLPTTTSERDPNLDQTGGDGRQRDDDDHRLSLGSRGGSEQRITHPGAIEQRDHHDSAARSAYERGEQAGEAI